MTEFILLLIAGAAMMCLTSLRVGMLVILWAGFGQDVARKLVPDEPVYFTVTVAVLALLAFSAAYMQGRIPSLRSIPDWHQKLKAPVGIFVAVVVLQALAVYVYTSSIALAGIGLMVYLGPLPAFLMAYGFATSGARVIGLLKLYLCLSAAVSTGIYLSWLGFDWGVLRTVGEPLVVYSLETGLPVELPAGFMRAPEIAAWHAASGACVAVIVSCYYRRGAWLWIGAVLCIYLTTAVFLTGRRKFLIEILVFLPLMAVFLSHFRIGTHRLIKVMGLIALVGGGIALMGMFTDDTVSKLSEASLRHESSPIQESIDRLYGLTFGAFEYVIAANGLLGSGAGSGSQGAQHFGGGSDVVGFAAEGGLGKVLAELGVPGLLALLYFAASMITYLWRTVDMSRTQGPQTGLLVTGLGAFLCANAVIFAGAHQAFGDLFVLMLVGWFIGFIAASRRWATPAHQGNVPAAYDGLPRTFSKAAR